jgi:hypothetical protein
MGFKKFFGDILKKVIANLITLVIIIVGLFLIYKFFLVKLFF